jgi:hypothetical protein
MSHDPAIPSFIKNYRIKEDGTISVQLNALAFNYQTLEKSWNNRFTLPSFDRKVEFQMPQAVDTRHKYRSEFYDDHQTEVSLIAYDTYPAGTELAVSSRVSHDHHQKARRKDDGTKYPNAYEIWFHEARPESAVSRHSPFAQGFEDELRAFVATLPEKGKNQEIPNTIVAAHPDIIENRVKHHSLTVKYGF